MRSRAAKAAAVRTLLAAAYWTVRSTNAIAGAARVSWAFADRIREQDGGRPAKVLTTNGRMVSSQRRRRKGNAMEEPEADLLAESAARGDQGAVRSLWEKVEPTAKFLIRLRVRPADRDDLLQDAAVMFLRCVGAYRRERGPFAAYFSGAIRRLVRSYRVQRSVDVADLAEPSYEETHPTLIAEDLVAAVPADVGEVIRAYFGLGVREQSINQIAAMRGWSPAKVRSVIDMALGAMRHAAGEDA